MKSEERVKIPLPRDRALAGTCLGGQMQVSQGVKKAKKCLVFSSFEHRCIYSFEHDNKCV